MNTLHSQLHLITCCAMIGLLLISSSCTTKNTQNNPALVDNPQSILVDQAVLTLFRQALEHLLQQEHNEAIILLESLTSTEKRFPAPYVNLAIAYSRTGQIRQAEQNFIMALRLDVGHAVANNELGLLYRESGRFAAARTAYQNALVQHPDYLPARRNLGILCELYIHDLECALEQYKVYLEYEPEDKTIEQWMLELTQRINSN